MEGLPVGAVAGGVGRVQPEPDLGTGLSERGEFGGRLGDLQGEVEPTAALGEAEAPRVVGVEDGGGEHKVPSRTLPEEPGEPVHRPRVDHESKPRDRHREAGRIGDHPQIAGQRQLHPQPHTRALDGGDGEHGGGGQVIENLGQPLGEGDVLEFGQIGPRAEMPGRSGEHHCPGAIGDRGPHGGIEGLDVIEVEGAAALGPVDGEDVDRATGFGEDRHRPSLRAGGAKPRPLLCSSWRCH